MSKLFIAAFVCCCIIALSFDAVDAIDAFDLGYYPDPQIDEPLSFLWNNRDHLLPESYASCKTKLSSGVERDGTCMHGAECKLSKGQHQGKGTCSFWQSCCVFERTCNTVTKQRVSYFVNPPNARTRKQNCNLRVELINERVCQLRVDIIETNLLPPTETLVPDGQGGEFYKSTCTSDKITVADPFSSDVKIPDICGKNKNQHFYVHLQQERTTRAVIFNAVLQDSMASDTKNTLWNLKITQLECPIKTKNGWDYHSRNKDQMALDYPMIAPPGCLQYFTEPKGEIKNFGYLSNTDTTLTTNNNYAICFKRRYGQCGVNFVWDDTTHIEMRNTLQTACSDEYLLIPEMMGGASNRICTVLIASDVQTSHPGPLYIRFFNKPQVLKETPPAVTDNLGFFIKYDLTTCN